MEISIASRPEDSQADRPRKRPAEYGETTRPSKRPAVDSTNDGDEICQRCKSIQWLQLTEQAPSSRYGKIIAHLSESQETLRQARCLVCRLLASIKPKILDSEVCQLKAFSSRLAFAYDSRGVRAERRLPPRGSTPESTIICIVPKKEGTKEYIARTGWYQGGCLGLINNEAGTPPCGPRMILPQGINYALIKYWMSLCYLKHSNKCSPLRIKKMPELRVIDCQTKSVIQAPTDCRYVALSYVWGQASPSPSDSSEFAPTIEDSISVTLSLGFRYLWVDKHCIDQNDPRKQNQIDRMDEIYSEADLTLVAGAGADANYGLPGVGKRERRSQGKTNVGSITLLQIFPHTSFTIHSSVWASRGWTYQEGVLSRRRLIFTDDQVSFLCNFMHCSETLNMPPEPQNTMGRETQFVGILPRTVNIGKKELWGEYREMKGHIMEFSKRRLSYNSDALNAILGIFHSLRSFNGNGLNHLWGMPIKFSPSSSDLVIPLHWYHNKPAIRREDFPGWSWTGWDGSVCMTDPDMHVLSECQIEVSIEPEARLSLVRYMDLVSSSPNRIPATPPRELLVTAKTVNVVLRLKTWGKLNDSFSQETQKGSVGFRDGYHATLPMTKSISAFVYAYLDQETLPKTEILGLILGEATSQTGVRILLLEQNGDDYRRIGILRYRHGRGTEAGGDRIPHIVFVDGEENVLDDVGSIDECPLWLRRAEMRKVALV